MLFKEKGASGERLKIKITNIEIKICIYVYRDTHLEEKKII